MDILIAEDDKDIAFMYMKLLEDRGYNVVVTTDGEECLVVYNDEFKKITETTDARQHIQPFDAVILDHRMPKMDGLEVAKEIISLNPHQRIILASAYSKDIFDEAAEYFHLPIEILQKPFSRMTLVNMLEDKTLYEKLEKYLIDTEPLKKAKLRHERLKEMADILDKQHDQTRE